MAERELNLSYNPKQCSVLLEGDEGIRVSPFVNHEGGEHYIEHYFKEVHTTYDAFLSGEKLSENGPCFGVIPQGGNEYQWISYSDAKDRAYMFGCGLIQKGFKPGQETFIGIYSQNRPEWSMTDLACAMFSMISVSLYDSLGKDSSKFIINTAQLGVVVCDTITKISDLLSQRADIPGLRMLVLMDGSFPGDVLRDAEGKEVELLTFQEVVDLGRENETEAVPPKEDDLYTVCFTSGTTGDPKGVQLSHCNLISQVAATYINVKVGFDFTHNERYLSYLPLAHMFERCCQLIMILKGCRVGFYRGNIKTLTEDIAILKPTMFITVPRLLNRIYDKIMSEVSHANSLKKTLFKFAFEQKKSGVKRGSVTKNSIWDKIVFNKIQAKLGGCVKLMLVSSAPMSPDILSYVRVVFGCYVIEAYGQTESTAALSCQIPSDPSVGHVGPPTPCFMVKLVDVSEKEYKAKDGRGEVCVKGPAVFKGYLKRPDLTAEAIDADGWLHTGDIGQWTENGCLKIIDRKKHIFKLAQGEYIAPEKVELVYLRSPMIAQCFVYGNSFKAYLVALVVPDENEIKKLASNKGLEGEFDQLCALNEVKQAIMEDIQQTAQEAGLMGFEKIKNLLVLSEPFTIESGLLTPTFKNKRPAFEKKFKSELEALYTEQE